MTKSILFVSVLGVAIAAPAWAASITVPNFSFENPAVSDGGSQSVEGTIPGSWTSTLYVRADNPVGNGVGVSGQSWTTPVPDGNQVLHMAAAGNAFNVQTSQMVPNTFVAGQTYTMTVSVGNSFEQDVPMHYAMRVFWVNGSNSDYMMLKTHLTDPVPNGEWRDVTGTFTVPAGSPAIGNGFIQVNPINGNGYDATNGQDDIYFDNIRISVTDVPEPALASALVLTGAGLFSRRRRS